MGREVRRVPANWKHPKEEEWRGGGFIPLQDRCYSKEADDWNRQNSLWVAGEHPDQKVGIGSKYKYFWEWHGMPPDPKDHVPYDPDDKDICTWWQAYETVSEGTPVSPAFATAEELIDYLAEAGDDWERKRARAGNRKPQPASREAVRKFVLEDAFVPSMVVMLTNEGMTMASGIAAIDILKEDSNG